MSTRTDALRRGALALLCAGATVLALAPAAAADPTPVGIGVARTDDTQRGTFRVPAWTDESGATLSSVTATVRDGDTVVTTVPLTVGNGFWSPASPLTLTADGGKMPHLGRYTLDVTASDDHGNELTRTDAGTLDFTMRPLFADVAQDVQLRFTPATLTPADHATAVSGLLEGIVPGTLAEVPVANEQVQVTRAFDESMPNRPADTTVTAATGADGVFTTAAFDQPWSAYYTAHFVGDDQQVHGVADMVMSASPTLAQTETTLRAKPSRTQLNPGQTFTVSGTVRKGYAANGALVPGARVTVALSSNPDSTRTVVTNSAGAFSVSLVAVYDSYPQWYATMQDAFYTAADVGGPLQIADESAYTAYGISLLSNGNVTAHGTLGRHYPDNSVVYGVQVTHLEYSANGRTGWRSIATARGAGDPVTLTAPGYVDGYYRLHHYGSAELAAATTPPVHLHRIVTRVYGNAAAPKSVRSGAVVTVHGTLQAYSGRWRTMGVNAVDLFFRPATSKRYAFVSAGRSDAHGRITLRGKATTRGYWLLQYFGDAKHFDSVAIPALVGVR